MLPETLDISNSAPRTKESDELHSGVSDELEKRYNACLNKVYGWAVYRNRAPVKDRSTLNLDLMVELANRFGNPQKAFKVVHVAGTNGKGSVSLKTARCL